MKSSHEVLKKLKKGDFAVVCGVVTVSAILFVFSFTSSHKLSAQVYYDGELYTTVRLYEIQKESQLNVGSCTLLIENDGVTFLSSECEDRLCVNRGKLKKAGDTMACVPERVSVVLKADKNDTDAVAF